MTSYDYGLYIGIYGDFSEDKKNGDKKMNFSQKGNE